MLAETTGQTSLPSARTASPKTAARRVQTFQLTLLFSSPFFYDRELHIQQPAVKSIPLPHSHIPIEPKATASRRRCTPKILPLPPDILNTQQQNLTQRGKMDMHAAISEHNPESRPKHLPPSTSAQFDILPLSSNLTLSPHFDSRISQELDVIPVCEPLPVTNPQTNPKPTPNSNPTHRVLHDRELLFCYILLLARHWIDYRKFVYVCIYIYSRQRSRYSMNVGEY